MPLLRYLWAAMKRPKDGANFSWQLNAAPDGCSSQCWNYSPDRAANKPISLPCSTTKEVIFLLATSYAVRKAGYRADGKQTTLATCTAPLPLFQQLQQISEWTWCISHTRKKNIFRYDSLRKKFLEEQQCSAFQIKHGNKHEARKGNHTHGCSSRYCFKLHKRPRTITGECAQCS